MSTDDVLIHSATQTPPSINDTFSIVAYFWANAHMGVGLGIFLVILSTALRFFIAPCTDASIKVYSWAFTEKLKAS